MAAASVPIPMRVYALEGITATQDDAISRQGLSLAEHAELLGEHTTELAVHENRLKTNDAQITALTALTNKVIWGLVGLSLTIAGSAVTIALTIGNGG